MRILYLGKDIENFYDPTWYYVLQQLAKTENLISYGPKYHYRSAWIPNWNFTGLKLIPKAHSKLNSILKLKMKPKIETDVVKISQKEDPDVILIGSFFPPNPAWKNLKKVKFPKAIVMTDPHYRFEEKLEYIKRNKIDLCLSIAKFVFRWPEFTEWAHQNRNVNFRWLPHSVNIEVFRDYGLPRNLDVLSSGSYSRKVYPFRVKIKNTLERTKDIKFLMPKHARFDLIKGKMSSQILIRERYAKFLSQSKLLIFGSSIYNYPVAKYFEGMACNTLVMAPMPNDGMDLHFIPDENFIEVNQKNFLDKIHYYLRHGDERCEIALRGMETVRKYHAVPKRAKQLIRYLESIK